MGLLKNVAACSAVATLALALGLSSGPIRGEAPAVHALVGARIVVSPGEVLESGTVVLRDGVLESVGAEVEAPPDARIWDLEGKTLYPGLIEIYLPKTWPEGALAPQGGSDNPLVTPHRQIAGFAYDEGAAKRLREAGFTTALVVPATGLWRGQSAILNLGEGGASRNLLDPSFAQHAALETSSDGYPGSQMGVLALLRQTLADVRWSAEATAAWRASPAQRRPEVDLSLGTLEPAGSGDQVVILEGDSLQEALRLARLAREQSLHGWLVGSGEEYRRPEALRKAGLPLLLPLAFPEAPDVSAQDDLSVSLETLRHWQSAPGNPKAMVDLGIPVAFTAFGLGSPKEIYSKLDQARKHGLSEDEALAAWTTVPAQLLGIEDRAGTLTAGKMANLLVVDGKLWIEAPKIEAVWVDGVRYAVKESKPPTVEPAGTWQVTVKSAEGFEFPLELRLSGEVEALKGAIFAFGAEIPLTSVSVSGSTLEASFDGASFGQPGTTTFVVEIRGQRMKGSGQSGQGNFTVSGNRTSQPEQAPEERP